MFLAVIILLVGWPAVLFAYGDPVSAGWLFQLAFPILMAASAALSLARKQLGLMFGRTR